MKDKPPHLRQVEKVSILPVLTSLDVEAERVLSAALDSTLKIAIVVGVDSDGSFYFGSSVADGGTVLWWLEKAKQELLRM